MTRVETLLPNVLAAQLPLRVADRRVNWLEVARKDVADACQTWLLWALCGLFTVLMLLAPMHPVLFFPTQDSGIPFRWGIEMIGFVTRWFLPLSALLVGAVAVEDEREGGNLRVLLGLPITRRDALIGKFLGRSVVFSSTLLVGLVLAGAEVWYFFIDFNLSAYAVFVGLTLLSGLVFVAIGVGISGFFQSRDRAVGAAMSLYVLFTFAWQIIPAGLFYLGRGRFVEPNESVAPGYVFSAYLNPVEIHQGLVSAWLREHGSFGTGQLETTVYKSNSGVIVASVEPFYLQPTFLLLVLILWGVVPLVVGAWRFSRADLG